MELEIVSPSGRGRSLSSYQPGEKSVLSKAVAERPGTVQGCLLLSRPTDRIRRRMAKAGVCFVCFTRPLSMRDPVRGMQLVRGSRQGYKAEE